VDVGLRGPETWDLYVMKKYQYLIVSDSYGIREINQLLSQGWRPVRESPMGAAGSGERGNAIHAFSLVLLEKEDAEEQPSPSPAE
jgi:hypothetical protein